MSFTPNDFIKYAIKIGSTTLDATYPIHSIIVDKRINRIPYAKIVVHDGSLQTQTFSITNNKTFTIGESVTVQAGYGDTLSKLFQGVIAKLAIQSQATGLSTLIVTCRDIAYKTTLTPNTMHFSKSKDSEIFKKILNNYSGLKNSVESTNIVHESIIQHEISDWDFLNIRAEANGKVLVVNEGLVAIKKPKNTGKGSVTYKYGVDFTEFNAEIDAKNQWTGAIALAWDSGKQTMVSAKIPEPGEQSMGDVSYKKLTAATKQNPVSISHCGIVNTEEIKTLAAGLLGRSRIAKIKGSMVVPGNAKLLHDQLITIQQGAEHFSGDTYVSGIHHVISNGNWQTTLTLGLESERYMHKYKDIGTLPAAGMFAPMHGLQLGVVKQITQDPQKHNRILVHLPLVQSKPQEGIWCRLASFYATQQSGMFFIPELEDEVVVGFINDDIRFPIILGSLYSNQHAPPKIVDQNNLYKSFVSKEKLEFTFHDDKEGPEIIIKTPQGGIIQLSDKDKSIKIIDQNNNKVILSKDGIDFTSSKDIHLNAQANVTIKSGKDIIIQGSKDINLNSMNLNAKASMKAIVSGNASTEIKSNMTTIIKGTTVLIN